MRKGIGAQSTISIVVGVMLSLMAIQIIIGLPSDLAAGDSLGGSSSPVEKMADRISQVCEGDSSQGSVNIDLADGASILIEDDNTLRLDSPSSSASADVDGCNSIEGVGEEIEYGGSFSIQVNQENGNQIATLSRG